LGSLPNQAPTDISITSTSVAENAATGTVVGTLSTTDADVGDAHTYTLVAGAGDTDYGSFSIAGNSLKTAAVFDEETKDSYSVRVRTTDSESATYEESFTITVTDVNEAPTDVSIGSSSVAENEASGTVVGTFSTVDEDVGDTHTCALVAGAGDTDNGSFAIDGTSLKTAAVFDHEMKDSYSIQVRTTDSGTPGLTYEESFTITVTDVNEAPVFTSTADTSATGDAVYTYPVTASDEDVGASLTMGAPTKPSWLILTDHGDGTATLTGTPSNADAGSHPVVLTVSDGIAALVQQSFSITVNAVYEVRLPGREGVPINRSQGVSVSLADDVTGKGFVSLQTVLTYDGSIIHPLEILTEGTMTEGWTVELNVDPGTSPDTLRIAMATAEDTLVGSGTLFTIHVEGVAGVSVGDSTVLHFESFQFNEDTTNVDTQDGVVYIAPPARSLGDVTGNGVVTAYDAARILRHTVGLGPAFTDQDSIAADVSGRMGVSAYDACLILQYVVGKIAVFPADTGGEDDPTTKALAFLRTLSVGKALPQSDGRFSVPILIDEMAGVVAGEMTLSFSGGVGEVAVRTTDLTSRYLLAGNVQEGCISASFAGAESRAGAGPVLEVVFDVSDAGLLSSLRLERVSLNEGRIPICIEEVEIEIPTAYRLRQNYPNPFNPETTITCDVASAGTVRLAVYASTGQLVRTLVDEERSVGTYSATWDGTDEAGRPVGSGVYLCRMEAGPFSAVRKLLLIR